MTRPPPANASESRTSPIRTRADDEEARIGDSREGVVLGNGAEVWERTWALIERGRRREREKGVYY